jgi:PhnB protein
VPGLGFEPLLEDDGGTGCGAPAQGPEKVLQPRREPFYITLQGGDAEEIKALWDALGDGAAAPLIPLAPAAFAPLYGMLTDRFGVTWIVGVDSPQSN